MEEYDRIYKMAIDILDFLAEQREQASDDLQESILEFETLWERKLWHELTERLLRFFDNPNSSSLQLSFFNDFILSFGDKINPIKLVDLAHKASRQCTGEFELCYTSVVAEHH